VEPTPEKFGASPSKNSWADVAKIAQVDKVIDVKAQTQTKPQANTQKQSSNASQKQKQQNETQPKTQQQKQQKQQSAAMQKQQKPNESHQVKPQPPQQNHTEHTHPEKKRAGSSNSSSIVELPSQLAHVNPKNFDTSPTFAKFFVIKSFSEDDVHKSIKYSIWTSTEAGNKRLDRAYRENYLKGPIYLFFSVNGSGQFCGLAEMKSIVDYSTSSSVWNEDGKWTGQFSVTWIFIKDISNSALRHIRLVNNENKPVTNSRDTQEVLYIPGCEVLKIFHSYQSKNSILDDFAYYNECEKEKSKLLEVPPQDSKKLNSS